MGSFASPLHLSTLLMVVLQIPTWPVILNDLAITSLTWKVCRRHWMSWSFNSLRGKVRSARLLKQLILQNFTTWQMGCLFRHTPKKQIKREFYRGCFSGFFVCNLWQANLCLEDDLANELDAVEELMLNVTEIAFYETKLLGETNCGCRTLDC
jgi:hypothetical protein